MFYEKVLFDSIRYRIGHHRRLRWWNPLSYSDAAYFADDTLDYAVELIDSISNTRVVLLDSVGINSRSTPGSPGIHGTKPLRIVVRYVVPSNLNNATVMMRLRPYSRGNGAYYFSRLTGRSAGLSDELKDSTVQQWIAATDGYYIR